MGYFFWPGRLHNPFADQYPNTLLSRFWLRAVYAKHEEAALNAAIAQPEAVLWQDLGGVWPMSEGQYEMPSGHKAFNSMAAVAVSLPLPSITNANLNA